MNYAASVSDYFKSPKWMMNTLLAGVCVLIPFIGPIVIKGWLITGFWGRQDDRFETFPDFDFNNFGKYLERGLWPFLVTLASSLALTVAACVVIVPLMMIVTIVAGSGGHNSAAGCATALLFALVAVLYIVLMIGIMMLLTPLTIRATLVQEFGPSFNLAWVKHFMRLMWKEILLSSLFLFAVSLAFSAIGILLLCVGVYFAMVPVYFSWVHLHKQLYRIYLSRGGEPVPMSPQLSDLPATL
jgi:hypothetical protein